MKLTEKTRIIYKGCLGYIIGIHEGGDYLFRADEENKRVWFDLRENLNKYFSLFGKEEYTIGVESVFFLLREDELADVQIIEETPLKILQNLIIETKNMSEEKFIDKTICHWVDGIFKPCIDFDPRATGMKYECYCTSCSIDISKPVDKAIVSNSGETFVARYKNKDYIATDPDNVGEESECFKQELIGKVWKDISEVGITDELAKLRPLLMSQDELDQDSYTLLGVVNDFCIFEDGKEFIENMRLATVEDLQKYKEK